MADYSYTELMKMQNDAVRRAEDMQKRARQSAGLEKNESASLQENTKKEEPRRVPMPNGYLDALKQYGKNSSKTQYDSRDKKKIPDVNQGNSQSFLGGLDKKISSALGDTQIDSDKALLLSLILLLSQENADEMLILALIYMMT